MNYHIIIIFIIHSSIGISAGIITIINTIITIIIIVIMNNDDIIINL